MRIVMPLFNFYYEDSKDFVFGDNKYSLQEFVSDEEIPQKVKEDGLSKIEAAHMKLENWALVAEYPDLDTCKKEKHKPGINLLLMSFKIYKLANPFIKYRLCKEDINLCSRIEETIVAEERCNILKYEDLISINHGFMRLLEMDKVIDKTHKLSRMHNALYFLYRGFFSKHWIDSFIFLTSTLESLFSKEDRGEATKTICLRVSKFLASKEGYSYKDIEKLYNIRSRLLHGNIKADFSADENLKKLHDLELVVIKCMREMLDNKIYFIYEDIEKKENYFNSLVKQ